jgi:putative tricarboxylic transport membrane protein
MKKIKNRIIAIALAVGMAGILLAGCGMVSPTAASAWTPEKPITILVGNSAGGGADLFAREIAKIITDNRFCDQPVVVENKPGGGHSIAFTYIVDRKDPYIIGVTSSSYFTVPLSGNSPVSPADFTPVAHLVTDPTMVLLKKNTPFKSIEELIEYAKANPGKLKFAGSSSVSDDRILCEKINEVLGIEIQYVTFESGSDVLATLLGGHADMGAMNPSEATEHAENGTLTPLAVAAPERFAGLPDTPTFIDLGYNIVQQSNRSFVVAKGIPQEVVDYYSDMFEKAANTSEWKEYTDLNGMFQKFLNAADYVPYHEELLKEYKIYIDKIMEKDAG